MWKRLGSIALLGGCAFAGGATAILVAPKLTGSLTAQSPAWSSPVAEQSILRLSDRFEQVSQRASPSVVAIEAVKTTTPGKGRTSEESGSGVLIEGEAEKSTYVLTNNHVISGAKPEQVTISLSDGRIFRAAQVWADPESDVAVLRIDKGGLPVAKLGDSDKVRVGQWVLAIGSPFGLNQSVTHGIISARERGQISLGGSIRIKDFLQTDAPINPGSSGGPLINMDGEVIGINTAIASNSNTNSGVAFSIPINLVRKIARQLLEHGAVNRGFLGLHLAAVFEPADAIRLGLDHANGALIETVYPDTPAATAGLKTGDVILKLNETPIRNENQLINLISGQSAGQKIRLHVWREKKMYQVEATIGDWRQAQTRLKPASMP
jgi:S1-C subfamily serine protease